MARHDRPTRGNAAGPAGGSAPRAPGPRQDGGGNLHRQRLRVGGLHDPEEARARQAADSLPARVGGGRGAPSGPAAAGGGVSQPGARLFGEPGRPLDPATRGRLEPAFGRSLADVRLHRGQTVDDKAEMLGAAAFTLGSHIGVNSAAAPAGGPDDALLAHELAHVAEGDDEVIRRQALESVPPDVDPDSISASISFDLPGGLELQSSFASDLETVNPTTVTLTLSRTGLDIHFSPALLLDLNWMIELVMANDITWSGAHYDFATASTSVSVGVSDLGGQSVVAPELAGTVSGMVSSLVAGTPAASAGYDPLTDADPAATLRQIQQNFQSLPSGGGGSALTPEQVTNVTLGGSFSTAHEIRYASGDSGVVIPPGTTISVSARMAGTAAQLGGDEPPRVSQLTLNTSGIILQSGGEDALRVQSLTVSPGGAVQVTRYEPLGSAASAAGVESGLRFIGLLALLGSGQPSDRLAASQIDPEAALQPRFVRGLTLAMVNSALTSAIRQLIIDNADAIPGIDLKQIFQVGSGAGDFPLPSGPNRYG
ncbi:protein of unknown function [Tistlia consotensis]|uniref:eCIS core domain-containing protein n=1 Tax=Tistlia consotensis USBA 355 TaxID=560819 RepID=A0A1Y6BHI3_9PROT|nr:DUF4157 domain-containing protein [Tistlia consotensis]SMF03134.1 protein of unknown function [Tistlia consotensis USBA 355]SNR53474.1 protein of unknown function [Tistlia consotensis]